MLSLKTAETGNMKTQLLCLMLVVFVATVHGMLFNCADLKHCNKCPPIVRNCRNVRKCGCCHICLDMLRKGESCGKPFLWHRKCKRGFSCDRKSLTCQPQTSYIPKMFRKSFYAAIPPLLDTNPYIKCHQGLCYCIFEGKRLRDYHVFVRMYAGHYVCRCAAAKARDERIGKVSKQCGRAGGYRSIQCEGSKCYCALEHGTTYGHPHPYDYFGKATNPCTMVG